MTDLPDIIPPAPDRLKLRYEIEEAIEAWRDRDETAEPGILHLYDPNEVKELARAVRDRLMPLPTPVTIDARDNGGRS